MKIKLPSGRLIGHGEKPFIIAEVGSNFKNFDDCKNSISMAKQCGADAVKFQLFARKDLYGPPAAPDSSDYAMMNPFGRGTYERDWDDYMHPDLGIVWLPKLKEKAMACGIEFMCSAFSPELVESVDPFVNIHKVASAELTHVRMLEKLAKLGKPVILSTGASGANDIRMALEVLKPVPVVLMYCVAAYPAREVNLEGIHALRDQFPGHEYGYSDHSLDVLMIPSMACRHYGASVIEKHFTVIPEIKTPDQEHSLNPGQLKRMVDAIHKGLPRHLVYNGEENDMIMKHNRRLIAIKDIKPGEILKENENFGIYRALQEDASALSPWVIGEVNGKPAKREILAGNGIGPGDL